MSYFHFSENSLNKNLFIQLSCNIDLGNMQPANSDKRVHKCNACGKTFSQKHHLKAHIEAIHRTSYSCKVCDEEVLKKDQKAHKLEHNKWECDFCDLVMHVKNRFRHVRTKHRKLTPATTTFEKKEKKLPKCDLCDLDFHNKANLNKHKKRKHVQVIDSTKKKKKVTFNPESSVREIPKTKASIKGIENDLLDFHNEVDKILTIAIRRSPSMLISDLSHAYERNTRKSFSLLQFRILTSYGLYDWKVRKGEIEVFVQGTEKLDPFSQKIRKRNLISQIQNTGRYVDLVEIPEKKMAEYQTAKEIIAKNAFQPVPLEACKSPPLTLLEKIKRKQAIKENRERQFKKIDWQKKDMPELARLVNTIFISERRNALTKLKLLEKIDYCGYHSGRPITDDLKRLMSLCPNFLSEPLPGFVRRDALADINMIVLSLE